MTDWRLPEHRREHFQRMYTLHLETRAHPGCVYSLLPAMAEHYGLDDDQRAWLVWLNGNTQNPVTSLLLLEAAPRPELWRDAVAFWNEHFKLLQWDTDRRHQKSKFGEATEKWVEYGYAEEPAAQWRYVGAQGWDDTWSHAFSQPYMGRLSAWSMTEYARILFGNTVPDAATLLLDDKSGSQSHRNGLSVLSGYEAAHWEPDVADMLGIVPQLKELGESLLQEAQLRNPDHLQDVTRLTLESTLCTYKSQYKPNRRYPGVYADMAHNRIRHGEAQFGQRFSVLWEARQRDLPEYLRAEDNGVGLTPAKQNYFRETGQPVNLSYRFSDMEEDPTWTP